MSDPDLKDRWASLYGVHDGWVDMLTDYHNQVNPHLPHGAEPLKCTCGVSVTLGTEDDIQFHSSWCDLVLKGDKK